MATQHEHVWYPAAPYSEALRCACGATTTYCTWRTGLYGGTLGAVANTEVRVDEPFGTCEGGIPLPDAFKGMPIIEPVEEAA